MIIGAHIVIYSKDAQADRAFFSDVLGFTSVNAGKGWLIFALPPAEAPVHPAEDNDRHEFYLMCDDLKAQMAPSARKGWPARKSMKLHGVLSRGFKCPGEARLASINLGTLRP